MKKSIILVLIIGILGLMQANDRFNHHYKPQHRVHSNIQYDKHHTSKHERSKRQIRQNKNEIVKLQNRIMYLAQQNRKHYAYLNNRSSRNNIVSFNLMFK